MLEWLLLCTLQENYQVFAINRAYSTVFDDCLLSYNEDITVIIRLIFCSKSASKPLCGAPFDEPAISPKQI